MEPSKIMIVDSHYASVYLLKRYVKKLNRRIEIVVAKSELHAVELLAKDTSPSHIIVSLDALTLRGISFLTRLSQQDRLDTKVACVAERYLNGELKLLKKIPKLKVLERASLPTGISTFLEVPLQPQEKEARSRSTNSGERRTERSSRGQGGLGMCHAH